MIDDKFSVEDMNNKNLLYDLLEECGGISEFILPLVVTGHFSHVIWLHHKWCTQLSTGVTSFIVGDNVDHKSGVSSVSSYYLDEGLSYSCKELTNGVEVKLLSCFDNYFESYIYNENNENNTVMTIDGREATKKHNAEKDKIQCKEDIRQLDKEKEMLNDIKDDDGWILDICLDYFTVTNPCIKMLDDALSTYGGPCNMLKTITDMFHRVRYRSHDFDNYIDDCCGYTLSQSRKEREEFLDIIHKLLSDDDTLNDAGLISEFLSLHEGIVISTKNIDEVMRTSNHPAVEFIRLLPRTPRQVKDVIIDVGEPRELHKN